MHRDLSIETVVENDFFRDSFNYGDLLFGFEDFFTEFDSNDDFPYSSQTERDISLIAIALRMFSEKKDKKNLKKILDTYVDRTHNRFSQVFNNENEPILEQYHRMILAASIVDFPTLKINETKIVKIGKTRLFLERNYFSEIARKDVYNISSDFSQLMDLIKKDNVLGQKYGNLNNPGTVLYDMVSNKDIKGVQRLKRITTYLTKINPEVHLTLLSIVGDYGIECANAIYVLKKASFLRGETGRKIDYYIKDYDFKITKGILKNKLSKKIISNAYEIINNR